MSFQVELLDCTLRDGAYITESKFGSPAIRGIIKNMQDARVEIIECGWLKNSEYKEGTTFYHVPSDVEPYILEKNKNVTYVAMIDWDRYDTSFLPQYDGKSIDAIRVVFPYGRYKEAIKIGEEIRQKGYGVFFQAANTLAYNDDDIAMLAKAMNEFKPVAISVVDTFGAMFESDLDRILDCMSEYLDDDIKIGFHSHNNQQLAFALTMHFVEYMKKKNRCCVADATLCGMGRGAGNATTELVASFLNRRMRCNYDLDAVLDAIDKYMQEFSEKYEWGYSTPYFIAGMYQCHVNNIAYLLNNHRTNARDMRNIIESLSQDERRKYDYDILEKKYIENQSRIVEDEKTLESLKSELSGRPILLLCPGASLEKESNKIKDFIKEQNPSIIGVGAIFEKYRYDYLFFVNHARYEYAKEAHTAIFDKAKKILLSNIKTQGGSSECIINYNRAVKRGWKYFDNPAIAILRLLDIMDMGDIYIAGFDSFKKEYNESYVEKSIPSVNMDDFEEINREISSMYVDFRLTARKNTKVHFITESRFDL